ncbi:MAG: DUF255 domain-containing protein [Planctomycetota bacterium]|nr:DUF255 domain-containing protein [Planctomycetota bacterium]MDA1251258.1 DUF255 domain-containing protein [Planctomycetota bacterium]
MSFRIASAFALSAFCFALAANSADAEGVAWQRDLKKAAAESERTGKPILLQVTAEWCGYCKKMLRETFPDEQLAKKINECFIPVVLDADENEEIVDAIGITAFPSTVIISPDLDVIGQVRGFHTPRSLERKIAPFCKVQPQTEVASAEPATKPAEDSARKNSFAELPADFAPRLPTLSIPAASVQPLIPEPAFGGLCLVSMLNERTRVEGQNAHSTVFQQQRLQFASQEHLDEFLAAPMKYWPLLDGRCPVAAARGETTPQGDPATVAVFRGQLIFFKDLTHRADFTKSPRAYFQEAVVPATR